MLDPVRDGLRVAQAVRVMTAALLDHHRDSAAELLINVLHRQGVFSQQRVNAAANMQQGHVGRGQRAELHKNVRVGAGIVGIDARHFVGMGGRPDVGVFSTPAHADKCGLSGESVLFREKGVPSLPLPAGFQGRAGFDITDVKTAFQQLNFRLRLVIPITAPPGPGITLSRHFGNDDEAPSLARDRVFDSIMVVGFRFERLDGQAAFIHQKIVTIKPVPGGFFAGKRNGRVFS